MQHPSKDQSFVQTYPKYTKPEAVLYETFWVYLTTKTWPPLDLEISSTCWCYRRQSSQIQHGKDTWQGKIIGFLLLSRPRHKTSMANVRPSLRLQDLHLLCLNLPLWVVNKEQFTRVTRSLKDLDYICHLLPPQCYLCFMAAPTHHTKKTFCTGSMLNVAYPDTHKPKNTGQISFYANLLISFNNSNT